MSTDTIKPAVSDNWTTSCEVNLVFVETEDRTKDGKTKRLPIKQRRIILSHRNGSQLSFSVTKTHCGWSIRDPRGESTKTATVWSNGKPKSVVVGCDKGKSLTPTAWVATVKNLIGEDKAHNLIVEVCYGIKPADSAE